MAVPTHSKYTHTSFFDEVIGDETESKLFNVRTVYTTLSGHNNFDFDTFEQLPSRAKYSIP